MERWRGKLAVVTGAGSGIGAAIARSLLDEGVNVVGLDLRLDRLREEAERRRRSGGAAERVVLRPLECDVASEAELGAAFDWIGKELGPLHVLVNNAGVVDYSPVIESDRETFERLININVIAVASCITRAVQSMKANNVEGHIFNINSILGHEIPQGAFSNLAGSNGWNLYPASKHATVAMTHTVRREISRAGVPIKITSISPGLVKTDIAKHNKVVENFSETQRRLDPSDIANALIYALGTRPEVQITEITVRSTGEL